MGRSILSILTIPGEDLWEGRRTSGACYNAAVIHRTVNVDAVRSNASADFMAESSWPDTTIDKRMRCCLVLVELRAIETLISEKP